jgi:hypothetical protein
MSLLDKLTGTRRPSSGVAPRSAEDVRAMLLDLDATHPAYAVKDGTPEGADVIAEWQVREPPLGLFSARAEVRHTVRIRLRLVAARREVRALEEQSEVKRVGGTQVSATYTRGPARSVSRQLTVRRADGSGAGATETFRFDRAELRGVLRDTVLSAGWTWRGVLFGRL